MEKQEKIRVEEALNKKAEEMREIKFYDVALELGYKHIKTEDVKDPNRVSSTESLFTTLVLTECEYQTEEEFLEEMQ